MPVPADARMFLHTIAYLNPADPSGAQMKRAVTAAYFVEDGSFTFFKNASHDVVLALKTDLVLLVERGVPS